MLPLDYSNLNQMHFQMADVIGNRDTSLKTPAIAAVVEFMRQGSVVETANLAIPVSDAIDCREESSLSI